MAITIGTHLGSHEITALLGRGGMGEVYRARDTKLKREVAIKILPDGFSSDPDRMARFQREAEALAALNHPNIAAIYDLQEENQTRFLVLELVEGDTLGDKLRQRGPMPVDHGLKIAGDIWAFGCVLYEMLTGRTPFSGKTVADLLGAIIHKDIDWTALPAATPPRVRDVLRRCLQKDVTRRLHDIADARIDIEDALLNPAEGADLHRPASSGKRWWLAWAIAVATLGVALAAISVRDFSRPELPEIRVEVSTPPTTDPVSFAISPH